MTIGGRLLGDDENASIYVQDPAGRESGCRPITILGTKERYNTWIRFNFAAMVVPDSVANMYFVVFNAFASPTGLRVEFPSAYLISE
jgi:hypothetical protein